MNDYFRLKSIVLLLLIVTLNFNAQSLNLLSKGHYEIIISNIWDKLKLGNNMDSIYQQIVNDGTYNIVDDNKLIALSIRKNNSFIVSEKTFYKTGILKQTIFYDKKGVQIGFKEWNDSGELIDSENFKSKQPKANEIENIKWVFGDYSIGYSYLNYVDGFLPVDSNIVILHYIGYFPNGKEFDNSYERGQPLSVNLNSSPFLKSFTYAIRQFKKEQKGYFVLSPDLAYGDKPVGNIPANSTLIYKVEIIDIK